MFWIIQRDKEIKGSATHLRLPFTSVLLRPVVSTFLDFIYSSIYSDHSSVSTTSLKLLAQGLVNLYPAECKGQVSGLMTTAFDLITCSLKCSPLLDFLTLHSWFFSCLISFVDLSSTSSSTIQPLNDSVPQGLLWATLFFSIYSLSPGISFAFMVGNTTYLLIILELIFPVCFGPLSYNLENLTAHISTWMSNKHLKLNMFAVELPSLTSPVPHPRQPPAQSCALFSLSKCSTSKSRDSPSLPFFLTIPIDPSNIFIEITHFPTPWPQIVSEPHHLAPVYLWQLPTSPASSDHIHLPHGN